MKTAQRWVLVFGSQGCVDLLCWLTLSRCADLPGLPVFSGAGSASLQASPLSTEEFGCFGVCWSHHGITHFLLKFTNEAGTDSHFRLMKTKSSWSWHNGLWLEKVSYGNTCSGFVPAVILGGKLGHNWNNKDQSSWKHIYWVQSVYAL